MKKIITTQAVFIVALLIAIIFLNLRYEQMLSQHQQLDTELMQLETELHAAVVSTEHIKQRMIALESKLKPQYQDLQALNQ